MNGRSLTRSTTDKFLGGVCGGLARYLNLDTRWLRGWRWLPRSSRSPQSVLSVG